MGEVITKSELARRCNVKQAAVTAWLARKKITAPALLADGRIDYDLALGQLRERLDPRRSTTAFDKSPREDARPPTGAAALIERAREQRIEENDVRLRRLRREELEQAGTLTQTEAVARAHARHFEELLGAIEQWLPELAVKLGADREGVALARREWRLFRERMAQAAEDRAAALPHLATVFHAT